MQRARVGVILAAVLAALVGSSRGDDPAPAELPVPHGPTVGNNRYQTSIQSVDGVADVDDYVGAMLPGEVLSASVAATKKSKLRPRLVLLGPDGVPARTTVKVPRSGASSSFRGFVIPTTGAWTVRVSGANGTEGDYVVTFTVKPARPQTVKGRKLGDDEPTFHVEKFHGVEGGLLDMKLTWSRTSNAVELKSLTDPHGGEVLTLDGRRAVEKVATDVRRRTISLTALPLHVGHGDYSARFRVVQGAAAYDATFSVNPRGRSLGRRPIVLPSVEPTLDAVGAPLRGRPGFALVLTGRNFTVAPKPHVFFGDYEGAVTGVGSDGKSITVVIPQGVPGTTVAVAVSNADGQSAQRPNYFSFLNTITVTDLVDDAGVAVRNLSTDGGRQLRVLGTYFEAGQSVSLGGVPATVVSVTGTGEMRVVAPPAPAGDEFVVVTDAFGGVFSSTFRVHFKTPPTFDGLPYKPSVAAVNSSVFVTISGKNFREADQLRFNGALVSSTYVDDKTRTFNVPALPAGSYPVTLTDDIGTVKRGPDFVVKPPPTISAVAVTAGPHIGARNVPVAGGATVQVDGTNFHESDVVTLGGAAVAFATHTTTRFTFLAPAGAPGPATLSIADGANQTATLAGAVRYVGYTDATSSRSPGGDPTDSLNADRAAVGDLDNDGKSDDVVLVSTYYSYVGTRTELTRLYFGDANGKLQDKTPSNFPATGSDSSAADDWNADSVALGDVDGANGIDVVIAGVAPYGPNNGVYKSVRLFKNDGSGHFTQDESNAPPSGYVPGVTATDQTGASFRVYSAVVEQGYPASLAVGDLDHDGRPEIVVGHDHYDFRYVGIDPTQVDFTQTPPYVQSANVNYLSIFQYRSATKVFKNDIAGGNGFVERTAQWMPACGDSGAPPTPCFQCLDLALGDIDGDTHVDMVETWYDPTTVTAFGTYRGPNVDTPQVATRVLRNDGTGHFTDATATWMPAGVVPEFWQANRLALVDLDKDGKLDLVLLHFQGTDAYFASAPSTSTTALRILRNTGSAFVDVTATAVPALPGNGDNFRGDALAVRDVDGDGRPDIVVGTTEPMTDSTGAPLPSTRLLRGGPGLAFTLDTAFLPPTTTDTGEASELLFVGDLAGRPDPSLILVSNVNPLKSAGGELLRVFDWNR